MAIFFDELITSKQNKRVKEAQNLLSVKGRRETSTTRFDGVKLFIESLACGVRVDSVFVASSKKEVIVGRLNEEFPDWKCLFEGTVYTVSDSVFSSLTEEKSPEGIISFAKYLDKSEKSGTIIRKEFEKSAVIGEKFGENPPAVALEAIRDPGNLGTVIRTALSFGIRRIYMSADCADVFSPKVIRSSMGAVFGAELTVSENLPETLCELKKKGYRINAAALYGDPVLLSETDLTDKDIFVIGNEGHGLSEKMLSASDRCVIIDMQAGPGCESLNASVAAAVCLWEVSKKIHKRFGENK